MGRDVAFVKRAFRQQRAVIPVVAAHLVALTLYAHALGAKLRPRVTFERRVSRGLSWTLVSSAGAPGIAAATTARAAACLATNNVPFLGSRGGLAVRVPGMLAGEATDPGSILGIAIFSGSTPSALQAVRLYCAIKMPAVKSS